MKPRRQSPRIRSQARIRNPRATVAPCHCAGSCRCSGLVHALLLMEIERDCEFFRDVP